MKFIYKYFNIKNIKVISVLLSIFLFGSCGDTGNTSTGGTGIYVLVRADTQKENIKGMLQIQYLGHPDILNGTKIPTDIRNSYWTCEIRYSNENKNSKIIENNKNLFSFKNKFNKDLYIFYTLVGTSNYHTKYINSFKLLDEAGFSRDYITKLLDIYKQEDENPDFVLKDSLLITDTKTGVQKKYIDRFSFYEKLIKAKYPYVRKLQMDEEYILKWEFHTSVYAVAKTATFLLLFNIKNSFNE